MTLATTPEIIAELRAGRMVILVDEEDRENEGDLVLAADFVTPEAINFMAKYGRGLICLTLTEERCRKLALPLMVARNRATYGTNFTVSIEAAEGVTTGISAQDRSHTIKVAVGRDTRPEQLVQPGHIFPLMAQNGGVLMRAGHTEAGCDLAKLAGMTPAAVICEILKDDGTMARLPDLIEFAAIHQLKIGAIADLIHYRNQTERLLTRVAERPIKTPQGVFQMVAYRDQLTSEIHLALLRGQPNALSEVLVRVHEPWSAVDLLDCDEGHHSWNLHAALAKIAEQDCGVLLLLHRTETGDDLLARLQPTINVGQSRSDLRNYGVGAQILRDLGVTKMKLMAQKRKMPSMVGFGLEVTGFVLPQDSVA